MNKWIIILVLLLGGGLLVWKLDLLQLPSAGEEDLLSYIPADTALYLGGQSSKEMSDFMASYPLLPGTSQNDVISALAESGEPPAKFLSSLIDQVTDESGSLGHMQSTLGLRSEGQFALFLHGAVPVYRAQLADPQKFNSVIEKAVADSGWTYTEATYGTANTRLWRLTEDDEEIQVDFAIAIDGTSVILTLLSDADDENVRDLRLGLTQPEQSLASTGEIAQLRKKRGYTSDFVMSVNIARIAQGILQPEQNSLGQDILRYLPKSEREDFNNQFSDACRTDYMRLYNAMPRLVAGYTRAEFAGDTMSYSGDMVLELTDKDVTGQLSAMRGHIPGYLSDSDESIFGMGVGLNTSTMTASLTQLWSIFTQTEFTCDSLVAMQTQAQNTNPAMLGMMTGMVQGLQGIAASFFEFNLDPTTMQPGDMDFIISAASENPANLAAMASMLPFPQFQQLKIPADGTPVEVAIPSPTMPLTVQAAIKGKHLVIYRGEQGRKAAEALTSEPLAANGLYGISINYRKMADMMSLPGMGAAPGSSCIEQQQMQHLFSTLNMDFSLITDVNEQGLLMGYSGSMDKPDAPEVEVVGTYQTEWLNEMCQFEASGIETINADGTGRYEEPDSDGNCVLYELKYTWEHTGNSIAMSPTSERSRETCDGEWETFEDTTTYNCSIINIEGDNFQCLYDAGTEDASLYRMQRM